MQHLFTKNKIIKNKKQYTVLEIQYRSVKCTVVTRIPKNFSFPSKPYKTITVCGCKQTTSKSFQSCLYCIYIFKLDDTSIIMLLKNDLTKMIFDFMNGLTCSVNEIYKTSNQNNTVTRNFSLKLFQPLRTKSLTQKCCLYLGPFIWNGFPDDVKLSNNLNKFKHKVKTIFLTLLREKDQSMLWVHYHYHHLILILLLKGSQWK